MKPALLGALAAVVILLAVAWAVRWQVVETHPAIGGGSAFLVNRWSGETRFLYQGTSEKVTSPP